MDSERINRVADAIERHETGFNMRFYHSDGSEVTDRSGHNCGTTACIYGHAMILMGDEAGRGVLAYDWYDVDAWLGIPADDWTTGPNIRYARNHPAVMSDTMRMELIPAVSAVRMLRHLAETGIVDWMV